MPSGQIAYFFQGLNYPTHGVLCVAEHVPLDDGGGRGGGQAGQPEQAGQEQGGHGHPAGRIGSLKQKGGTEFYNSTWGQLKETFIPSSSREGKVRRSGREVWE